MDKEKRGAAVVKYLSVCSGIEAATVAWHTLGWKPLAFSEIEPFPRRVLQHHYPDVPLHGDFTLLRNEQWIGDADILVGGTPCQAFSVAGLRQSLDDDRGNLTLEFVRLADAIDDIRHTRGEKSAIIVWENVPGVLSVKDNAFGCFLAALVGNDSPLVATGGKWTNAGLVIGPERAAAWRVLDAQYFGVAQRRRRVFVVASAREEFDPSQILFEFEGMRRDTPPSRKEGQEPSATIAARFGISRNNHEEVVTHVEEIAPTLTKEGTGVSRPGFQEDGWYVAQVFDRQRSDQYGEADIASIMSARDYKNATDLVARSYSLSGIAEYKEGVGTLRANGGDLCGGSENIIVHGTQDPCVSNIAFALGRNNGAENALMQPIATHEVAGAMLSRNTSGGFSNSVDHAAAGYMALQSMSVRRLMPLECERLQGFPDNYTNIPGAADGPRYKALGNSMAVPVMAWIGQKIDFHNKM